MAKDMEMLERNFVRRLVSYIASVDAEDEINFDEHDRRYHGGKYDPVTMTCEMRNANEKGDLYDVLIAEMEERQARLKFVRQHPELASDDEMVELFGRANDNAVKRLQKAIREMYQPAQMEGGGTLIGTIAGKQVFPHSRMSTEMTGSRNFKWLKKNRKDVFSEKCLIIRDIKKIVPNLQITEEHENCHKSNHHRAWQVAKGFATADLTYRGKPWYAVFTQTADGRLLLYDVVHKERGQVDPSPEKEK